jgi:hypothetical protein
VPAPRAKAHRSQAAPHAPGADITNPEWLLDMAATPATTAHDTEERTSSSEVEPPSATRPTTPLRIPSLRADETVLRASNAGVVLRRRRA